MFHKIARFKVMGWSIPKTLKGVMVTPAHIYRPYVV